MNHDVLSATSPSSEDDEKNQEILRDLGGLIRQSEKGGPENEPDAILAGLQAQAPGTRIGPFQIVKRLGEGGFADVFEAEQLEPVRRRVALKIMKTGRLSLEGIARFDVERQALAVMEHPSIAKIHEAGTTEAGQPYVAMEYVEGLSLTRFCQEHALSVDDKIKLLIQVARAVHHAHQKGVIHRDLKPSNILVSTHDGEPVPKVIDFGVAKVIEGQWQDPGLTKEHQVLGTLAYMSPEQLEGRLDQIDTRTDVHGLGVLAYELLTGTTPYVLEDDEGTLSYPQALEHVREYEPLPPSTRQDQSNRRPLIKGDLDWIVMKAIAKESDRRYESASAFADDLQRFLHHEPVMAAAPGLLYRCRKYVRRHRVLLAAASAVCLSMLAGSIMSLKQAARANSQAARANSAEEAATNNLEVATAVSEFLKEDLMGGKKRRIDRHDPNVSFRSIVDEASGQVDERFQGKPEIQRTLHLTLAQVYSHLSEFESAQRHLDRCLDHVKGNDDFELEVLATQGEIYFMQGNHTDARKWLERCLAHPLVKPETRVAEELMLTECIISAGGLREAERRLYKVLQTLDSDQVEFRVEALLSLAHVHEKNADGLKSIEFLEEAYSLCENEKSRLQEHLKIVEMELGRHYVTARRYEDAKPLLLSYVEYRKKRFGVYDRDYLKANNALAQCYLKLGETDAALPLLLEALPPLESRKDLNFFRLLLTLTLGSCYELRGELSQAEERFLEAEYLMAEISLEWIDYVETLRHLGAYFFRTNQPEKAIAFYQRVLTRNAMGSQFTGELERAIGLASSSIILPWGESSKAIWKVTESQPDDQWMKDSYDDSSWTSKRLPLGVTRFDWAPYLQAKTEWNTPDSWLRCHFTLEEPIQGEAMLHLFHDDSVKVYINGIAAYSKVGTSSSRYRFQQIAPEARASLQVGENVIAVHCHNHPGTFFRFIDVGLCDIAPSRTSQAIKIAEDLLEAHKKNGLTLLEWTAFCHFRAGSLGRAAELVERRYQIKEDDSIDLFSPVMSQVWAEKYGAFRKSVRHSKDPSEVNASKRQHLVHQGSIWQFNSEGKDLGAEWRHTLGKDWMVGSAPYGYETAADVKALGAKESKILPTTTYLQQTFEVTTSIDSIKELKLALRFDCGVAVYLNGREIARLHLKPNASFSDFATNAGGDYIWHELVVDKNLLVPGTNLVSVEVHQHESTISDIFFDLGLACLVE